MFSFNELYSFYENYMNYNYYYLYVICTQVNITVVLVWLIFDNDITS